ncbi:MAG TPA: toll/interleukin-1 receptor domain-containing protein [Pyrinomonadaceae bacterium]|jgi:hypothetical protein
MADIFLSYSREDIAKAKALAHILEKRGWSVWWDRKIRAGYNFARVIEQELNLAKCVIVLWSKTSVASDWVPIEASEGASREILIPAEIADVKVPLEFRRLQSANLRNWRGSPDYPEIKLLLDAVEEKLKKPGQAAPARHTKPRPRTARAKQPASAFQKSLLKLLKYSREKFKPIKGGRVYKDNEGYVSYDSRLSLPGTTDNVVFRNPQGEYYFACDVLTNVARSKAERVFTKKVEEIKNALPPEWSTRLVARQKGWIRKELTAVNKLDSWQIRLALVVYSREIYGSHNCDIEFYLEHNPETASSP